LISKELLNFAPANAKLIYAGKDAGQLPMQEKINRLIIKNARLYKMVVRLKGGDPMIFGRATEEIKCLIDNNIDFEIVPGITAASAAAAFVGLVLTDRNTASAVSLITAQPAKGKKLKIDFRSLVKIGGTIVFYMVVRNVHNICQKLLSAGLAPHTSAVVVANASLAGQKIIKATVSNISQKCIEANITPPAIMIIGKKCFTWLERQPLFSKKILITRDIVGNADFAYMLAARGAEAISYPTFEIEDLTDKREFRRIIHQIRYFDWIFFTSIAGVKLFFKAISKLNKDVRILSNIKIACIGSETADALKDFAVSADFIPSKFTSQKLAEEFIKKFKPKGKRILLLRSIMADTTLAEKLKSAKAIVKTIAVYTAKKLRNKNPEIVEQLQKGRIDWITFASSFAVKCFFSDFDPKNINKKVKIASIGPTTTETLKKFSVKPTVEAETYTIEGLIESMEKVSK
jgi:uroporphyrinogen III methyltransferase/synthase